MGLFTLGGQLACKPCQKQDWQVKEDVTSFCPICGLMWLQVEDMLKRSFAEFHAQRSHPEALQKLAEGKARLETLRAKPWPSSPHATSQQDVEEYYHLSQHIQALTNHIQASQDPRAAPFCCLKSDVHVTSSHTAFTAVPVLLCCCNFSASSCHQVCFGLLMAAACLVSNSVNLKAQPLTDEQKGVR